MQTKNENPLLTLMLTGSILIMMATLIGTRAGSGARQTTVAGIGAISRKKRRVKGKGRRRVKRRIWEVRYTDGPGGEWVEAKSEAEARSIVERTWGNRAKLTIDFR